MVGIAPCALTLVVEHFAPRTAKDMSVIRFALGFVHVGMAVHNRFGVIQ